MHTLEGWRLASHRCTSRQDSAEEGNWQCREKGVRAFSFGVLAAAPTACGMTSTPREDLRSAAAAQLQPADKQAVPLRINRRLQDVPQESLDWLQDEEAIGNAQRRASSLGFLAADWAVCAAIFILSDVLYLNGAPHWIISVTLAGLAAANWKLFDGTKPGEQACPEKLVTCAQQALLAARLAHQT